MKKILKSVVAITLVVVFATAFHGKSVDACGYYYTYPYWYYDTNAIQQYNAQVIAQESARIVAINQLHVNDLTAAAKNYSNYLQELKNAKVENVRIKKEIVDNYTNLAKVNPYFYTLIPQAQADYNNALIEQNNMIYIAQQAKTFTNSDNLLNTYAWYYLPYYTGTQDAGKFVMYAIGIPYVL